MQIVGVAIGLTDDVEYIHQHCQPRLRILTISDDIGHDIGDKGQGLCEKPVLEGKWSGRLELIDYGRSKLVLQVKGFMEIILHARNHPAVTVV